MGAISTAQHAKSLLPGWRPVPRKWPRAHVLLVASISVVRHDSTDSACLYAPPMMYIRLLRFFVPLSVAVLTGCGGSAVVSNAQPLPGTGPTALATGTATGSAELVPAMVGVPTDPHVDAKHRISAGDVLEIEVFQADELSTTERVNDAGAISLPLVGPVPVGGLTASEAEGRIAQALAKDYLQNPQVNVFVSEYADLEVSVGGEVNKPGVFPIRGRTTLLEGIALAGGTTRRAKEDQVIVFRAQAANAGVNAYVVDLKRVQRGELRDPLLAANDKVVVPKSGSRVFMEDVRDTLRGFVNLNPLLY
jgi:polysaccharide export outer membrane protein